MLWIFWFLVPVVILALLMGAIRLSFCVVTVESESMAPTLQDGDRLLIFRRWPARWLTKGQIVIVWPTPSQIRPDIPPKPFGVVPFIKRVVGLYGDSHVSYLSELNEFHRSRLYENYDNEGKRTWYVPKGYFFVRGDHPIGGFDSLSWGPIPFASLLGIVVLRLPRPSTNNE